ncbi:sensor histidine kinase [Paenibacillus sp. MCAF9]|uniref:sensor histidine kinase n=1 Tax=Paenibacillus sp. MCAF9 TaxID=3233046 RepID=UPI003F9DBBD1
MSRLSYYQKIQLSFLLFIIVPIITVSVISFVLIKETMVEKLQLSNDNFLNVMIEEIGTTIDDVIFASHFIVNDTNVRSDLKKFADTERLNTYADYTNFTNIRGVFSLITSKPLNNNIRMYLVNRKGFIISSNEDDLNLVNRNLDDLYEKIDLKRPETLQRLGMVKEESDKEGTYYMARVIHDNDDKRYLSVLIIGISESYFEKVLKPIEFGKVALFDAEGTLIAGSTELLSHDAAASRDILRSEVTLDKTDWTLVYEANKETFTGEISRTFYLGIGGVIFLFIIFSISSMFIARRLHRPIQKLQRAVRQFGMGNLDVKLEVKGKDDIAELGHSLNTMMEQLKGLIHDIEHEQELKRVMELEALFMQIRPHFLINTLNSIKCSLILQKDLLHSKSIDSLMSLLRAYLKVNEPTSLKNECVLLGHYIDIMKIRNEMVLELTVELEPGLEQLLIPKLMLQPLIENAIVHGLVDNPAAKISIQARRVENGIIIEIEDNGSGIEEEQLAALNHHLHSVGSEQSSSYQRVGLINVIQRSRLTFGQAAALALYENAQGGVTAFLHLPVIERHVYSSEG